MLRTVRTVIVDEIHAVLESRRGAHLALTLERLAHVAQQPLQRIGLSATMEPIEEVGSGSLDGGTVDSKQGQRGSPTFKVTVHRSSVHPRSSTRDTGEPSTSPWSFPARRSRRSCRAKSGARSTTGWPS